jgi:penicillin-binding protein-related factor A (putative recombinase)
MSETQIRNGILSWLKFKRLFAFIHDSTGIYDPKIGRFRVRNSVHRLLGVSDIIGIIRGTGQFLAIEVKSKTGRLTDHQIRFIERVNDEGGIAFMARSIEDVEREFKARGLV